jgi:RND family efflux transporter MFP subunit
MAPLRPWSIICRMPRPWLALLAVVLAAAGCTGQPTASASAAASTDKPAAASPTRAVKVFQAVEQRVPRTVTSTGALAADDTVVLGVKVPGRLVEQAVDLGTRVRRGQMVARIDATDYKLRVEQAEAALQQARARLGLALTGTDEQVDLERTSIVRQARAVLDEARLSRERSRKLLEQNLIARAQDDTAEANLGVAEGRYHDAIEEVRNRQATLTQRRSELDLARQQLTDTVLLSPFDGAVSMKQAAVGEYLSAGAPVATLVRTHPLRLRLPVPEREAVGVRVGHTVRLTVEGDATVYQGKVVRLSPIVQEQNRTLLVEAEVPNPNAVLKPGAFARAEIVTEGSQPVIRIPTASLVTFAGVEKVLAVRQGKIVEIRVQTGRRANDSIEIVTGLKPGETVVLDPDNLAPGQAVTAER